MSVEADFRATLAAHAPLTALVGTRISQNAVDQPGRPLVVFVVRHDPILGLGGAGLGDQCTITAQCWGTTAEQADAVANAVEGALAAGSLAIAACATRTARGTVYDEETGADGTELTIEWWV